MPLAYYLDVVRWMLYKVLRAREFDLLVNKYFDYMDQILLQAIERLHVNHKQLHF